MGWAWVSSARSIMGFISLTEATRSTSHGGAFASERLSAPPPPASLPLPSPHTRCRPHIGASLASMHGGERGDSAGGERVVVVNRQRRRFAEREGVAQVPEVERHWVPAMEGERAGNPQGHRAYPFAHQGHSSFQNVCVSLLLIFCQVFLSNYYFFPGFW